MTALERQGYDSQRAGTLDEELFRDDTAIGRQYREGRRIARREAEDALDRAEEAAPNPSPRREIPTTPPAARSRRS